MNPPMRLRKAFLMFEQSRLEMRETMQGAAEEVREGVREGGAASRRIREEYRREEEPGVAPEQRA
jgi:hypothetical protein